MKHLWTGYLQGAGIIILFLLYVSGMDIILEMELFRQTVWWILTALFTFYAVIYGITALKVILQVITAKKRRSQDISAQNPPPTPRVEEIIQQLRGLGFTRLGESRTKLPLYQPVTTWHMVSGDGSSNAEIIDLGDKIRLASMEFNTVYHNEAVLHTTYPYGNNKDFLMMRHRYNTSSLPDAYQQHLQESAIMQAQHGNPRLFHSMAEYRAWEIRYRDLYMINRLKNGILPVVTRVIWFIVLTSAMMFVGLFNEIPDLASDNQRRIVLLIASIFLIVEGIWAWWLYRPFSQIGDDIKKAKNRP